MNPRAILLKSGTGPFFPQQATGYFTFRLWREQFSFVKLSFTNKDEYDSFQIKTLFNSSFICPLTDRSGPEQIRRAKGDGRTENQ